MRPLKRFPGRRVPDTLDVNFDYFLLYFASDLRSVFSQKHINFGPNTEFWQVNPRFNRYSNAGNQFSCVVCLPIIQVDSIAVDFNPDTVTESVNKMVRVPGFFDHITSRSVHFPPLKFPSAGECILHETHGCVTGIGDDSDSWAFDGLRECMWHGDDSSWSGNWANGDVIGLAANVDAGKIAVSKNGSWSAKGHGVVFTDVKVSAGVYPAFSTSGGDVMYRMSAPFQHEPPPVDLWA